MLKYILVRCPICRCSLNVRRDYLGKTVACRYCDQAFVIRLGEEPLTVRFTEPSGEPPQGLEADSGLAVPWTGASEDWPSMVVDVRGAWDPEAHQSLAVTRTEQDPTLPGVEVVQVDLGSPAPGMVTVFAAEFERLRRRTDTAGSERDRLRMQVEQRVEHARQLAAAVQGGAEQLAAVRAELEQSRQALETARHCHESHLAGLSRELASATKQGEDRLATLREQFERECAGRIGGQLEEQRNRSETGLRVLDLTAAQLGSALRQRDHLTATGAGSGSKSMLSNPPWTPPVSRSKQPGMRLGGGTRT